MLCEGVSRETTESFCDGHVSAFAFLGGVPQSILYAGDPENERCDQLAVQAAHQKGLPEDDGYESPSQLQQTV